MGAPGWPCRRTNKNRPKYHLTFGHHLLAALEMCALASSSSAPTPRTKGSTACYDPLSECIKLPFTSSNGGALLEGSIIEIDTPPFQLGHVLLGEIVEIVIMDENMQPLAVYNENAASPREHQAAPPATRHFFTREELLRQQREQEQLHASEYQALLQQHQQEKQQLGAMQRSGKFSADSEARLKRVHQSELLELHEKQQREQAEMIDLIFQDAAVASTEKGKGGKISADEQVKYQPAVGISDGATAQSVAAGADALTMRTTSISAFIQKLNANDPSLTTIILDGRKSVTTNEWTMLFDSLEENTYLTHLSVADCGLDDDTTLPLALALVENETLISLNLSYNRELTNETGNSLLKVLRQSNLVMKQLMVDGTNISFEVSVKIQGILDDRDETKILEKMQAVRQQKIEELLAFSASDALSKSSERLSQKLLEADSTGTQGGKKLGRRK